MKENGFPSRNVVTSLPGYQIFVRKLRVPEASGERLRKLIQYEARQMIPFPWDKIQVDYHTKKIPDTNDLEILLVGSKKEIIADYMSFLRKSGLGLKHLDVSPVALYNFQKYIDPALEQETTALINIGAATTDISIVRDGILSFTRTAPVGGNDLTRTIGKNLNKDFKEAEHLKIQYGRIPMDYEIGVASESPEGMSEEKAVQHALVTGLERVVSEIRRTFDYYISQPDGVAISRVVVSGGTSLLQNIEAYLSDKLTVPVTLVTQIPEWQNMKKAATDYTADIPWITTAIGMAIRSAKIPNLIRVDFLPQDLQNIRDFKDKRLQVLIASFLMLGVVYTGLCLGVMKLRCENSYPRNYRKKPGNIKEAMTSLPSYPPKKIICPNSTGICNWY